MNTNDEKRRRGITALDAVVVILVILCVAGLVIRIAIGRDGVIPEGAPESAEYAVAFEISKLRASSGSDIAAGEVLYTEDGRVFGTVTDQVSVTPAKIYTEDDEGRYILSYSGSEGGDGSLVDIRGTASVEGSEVDYGFLVGSNILATPGREIVLHTDKLTATVRILDVTRVTD